MSQRYNPRLLQSCFIHFHQVGLSRHGNFRPINATVYGYERLGSLLTIQVPVADVMLLVVKLKNMKMTDQVTGRETES